jgi:hypothetical protein
MPPVRGSGTPGDAAGAVDLARLYVGRGWASARRPALLGLVLCTSERASHDSLDCICDAGVGVRLDVDRDFVARAGKAAVPRQHARRRSQLVRSGSGPSFANSLRTERAANGARLPGSGELARSQTGSLSQFQQSSTTNSTPASRCCSRRFAALSRSRPRDRREDVGDRPLREAARRPSAVRGGRRR